MINKPFDFDCITLSSLDWGQDLIQIMSAALYAVNPYLAVTRQLDKLDLATSGRIFVVGAGKAGLPMARAVVDYLGEKISGGQVTVKEGYSEVNKVGNVNVTDAGHPLPDERGIQATQEIIKLLENTTPEDLVVCLISGGGSALLTDPLIPLDDLRVLTDELLACGATINEINTLRKQLDRVKGGGLAQIAHPARIITLILSDVVGDPLDMIASGPTVLNMDTPQDALAVIEKYTLADKIPDVIIETLQKTSQFPIIETASTQNVLVGNNQTAALAALQQAEQLGYNTRLLTNELQGEAQEVGRELAETLREAIETELRPFVWVAGGETTVTIQGDGLGGRNQELALAAVKVLAEIENAALVTLATDGGDGPTDAAGAVVTGETLGRAKKLGLEPPEFIANNDSYNFFNPLGNLLKPGPTQTNVNDLVFLLGF